MSKDIASSTLALLGDFVRCVERTYAIARADRLDGSVAQFDRLGLQKKVRAVVAHSKSIHIFALIYFSANMSCYAHICVDVRLGSHNFSFASNSTQLQCKYMNIPFQRHISINDVSRLIT